MLPIHMIYLNIFLQPYFPHNFALIVRPSDSIGLRIVHLIRTLPSTWV